MITPGHRWGHPNDQWLLEGRLNTQTPSRGHHRREWEQTSSKLPHQVCAESMLSCVDSEANPHHYLSREKEGDISPCHTHQVVLFPAFLEAQASSLSSVLRHTGVSLGITHHKYPAMASPVPSLIIVCPIMRYRRD